MKEKSRSKMKRGLIAFLLALPLVLYGTLSRPQAPSPVSGGATQSASATSDPSYSGAQVINVVSFGAVGNGLTDDTAAINSALKACTTRAFPFNGCSLYFPSGIYITTGLTLPSYVHIRGDGWATSVIRLKPETAADVLTIPAGTFNFSITGVTLDGNAQHQSTGGNCLTTAQTPSGPNSINTANKRTASSNGYKDGLIYGVMFSNCTANGINIVAYNYELWFDDFFTYNNGIYGIYTQGTDSLFSNFVSERNGTSGVHVSNANNKFINAKVIWNGFRNRSEGAVFTNADRNIFTSVEAQDNYVSGFVDQGSDNQFIGCQADTNGYANRSNSASSRKASGFVISGVNGVYSGDKVTDYRGRLADGNYATEWPYTLTNLQQSTIDISYDGTNQPPPTMAPGGTILSSAGTGAVGHAACIRSSGPPVVIGFCSSKINSAGICTCN